MSKIIRDITQDMKCKIKQSDRDIHKAIERKSEYPHLAEIYYDFSIDNINKMLILHKEVEQLIEQYQDKSEIPKTMFELWEWTHKQLIEDVEEIKILQGFYKNL